MSKVVKPIVQDGMLWVGGRETAVSPPIPLNSPQWCDWLSSHKQFKYKGTAGHFSARRETRHGNEYWYAYRRRNGKLNKAYLGKLDELIPVRLEQVAANLAGKTVLAQLSLAVDSPGDAIHESRLNSTFPIIAKTRPPVLPPNLVLRPRLTDKIRTPITFISAPGGFGKSILLNIWQQECCDMPVAWATLDADDNHLLRFWSTVIMALRAVLPGFGQELMPYLQLPSTISPTEIVTRLTNEFVCPDGKPFCAGLVLDDFHHIQHPDIHTSLQTWLERLPPSLQLIISSRFRPPLALGRLRAMGLVTELDLDDLRFTLEEGMDLFRRHVRESTLAYGDIETLVKRTGGWAVGLTLAGLSLNKQQDQRHVLDSFSGAHLFFREYFMETALHQQSTAVQTFLLKTSILKQLTGALCDAVTGQTDGEQTLTHLWQQNLFITRSEEQAWYRYHDLFAEMLRNQLQAQFPDQIPVLHRLAAAWYESRNMLADAVSHLLFIEDWEGAAEVIEDVGLRELAESGEDSRLLRWLQQLPETVVQHHKTLLFVYLRLANLALHPREVERLLLRIEANILSKPAALTPDEEEVLAEINNIRHYVADDFSTISRLLGGEEDNSRWQLLDELMLVEIYHKPKPEGAERLLRELYDKAYEQKNLFVMLIAGASITNKAFLAGHLNRSEKFGYLVLQQVLSLRGKLPEPASIVLEALCRVSFERNELTRAEQFLQQAMAVDPNPTSSNMPMSIAIARAKLQSVQGQHQAAQATIQAARELYARRPSGSWRKRDLIAYEAWFCVRQRKWEEAEWLLTEAATEEDHPLSQLVRADMLLSQGRAAAAEARLIDLVAKHPHGFPNEAVLEARVMLALALFKQHKLYQARQVLAEAIRLAAPERFIRPFLDRGSQLLPLLVLSLHTQSLTTKCQEFVHEILQLLGYIENATELLPMENLKLLTSAAAVTEREQDVLQLVSEGLSNREIAVELCISPGTVKTHLANIYGKLDVNNRVQAVAEAQALKLI